MIFIFEKKLNIMINKTILFIPLFLSISIIGYSQGYTVEYSSNSYESLVNAIVIDESNYTIDGSGSELYKPIPIGFDFTYNGTIYDSLQVGENGYVTFTTNNVFESFINIFECPQMNFQDDPLLSPIYYEVSGNSGEQIFKLEFVKSGFVNDSEEDDYVNYQLWIYENCGVFEIHMGEVSINPAELDLFYNNSTAPFMGYGANNPFFFYILAGNTVAPILQTNALNTLNSVPDSGSVYTFRNCYLNLTQEEVEENSINIYPNPASEIVEINFNKGMEGSELRILNLSGQTIYSDFLKETNTYTLNIDFLSLGVYFVHIKSPTATYSSKLVKN